MRHRFHQILSSALLATYVGISLLGQGLHFLTADDHHHVHVAPACASHPHEHDAASAYHDEAALATQCVTAVVSATDHDCEICEFLAQAVSQPPQVTAPPDLHILVASLPVHAQAFHAPTIVGPHAPRGPPQTLA